MGNLQRSSSQRSTLTYQRNTYGLPTAAALAEPLRAVPFRLPEPGYGRLHPAPDGGTTRSPSIDSIHKDPRQVLARPGAAARAQPSLTPVVLGLPGPASPSPPEYSHLHL